MIYGYCRISTPRQDIERQVRNILASFPEARIVKEIYTGTKTVGRAEFNKLLSRLREGETIVFDEVSRMSRNAADGVEIYHQLHDKGIELIFLKEPHINTATYDKALSDTGIPKTGTDADLILDGVRAYLRKLATNQIELAFASAQKEVEYLHTRTKEGIETARLAGKQIGRQPGTSYKSREEDRIKKLILTHSRSFGGNLTDKECLTLAGCARNTYYKYKRQLVCENS